MRARWLCSLTLLVTTAAPAYAEEHLSPPSSETDAVAARLIAAVRVIEQNHLDPPPRQELVHRLLRSLAERFHSLPPFGAGRELSVLTDDAALEDYLQQFCGTVSDRTTMRSDAQLLEMREQQALQDLVDSLLGPNHVRPAKEQAVVEQFASNRYVGIGIALSLGEKGNFPRMHHVFEGGPAQQAGASESDLILKIDGEVTRGKRIKEVVERLRGPAGSQEKLVLRQPNRDEERELTITRGVVPIKHVFHTREDGMDAIRMSAINASTVQELSQIEEELGEETTEIIIEIEDHDSSSLHHAVMLADALLDGGPIGRVRTRTGVREFEANRGCLFRDVPLTVRTSAVTSGPAEWVIAALQDNDRATLIGQRTAGLPFVTETFDVPGTNWVLQLTTGVLERADGSRLLRTGLSHSTGLWPTAAKRPNEMRNGFQEHDGGVIPDKLVSPKSPTQDFDREIRISLPKQSDDATDPQRPTEEPNTSP